MRRLVRSDMRLLGRLLFIPVQLLSIIVGIIVFPIIRPLVLVIGFCYGRISQKRRK